MDSCGSVDIAAYGLAGDFRIFQWEFTGLGFAAVGIAFLH